MPRLSVLLLVVAAMAAQADDGMLHTISVSGIGSVEAPPDRAMLTLSIVARHPTVAAAQKEAGEVTAKVLAIAEDLDIPDNRVDTMSATVQPNYRWDRDTQVQELLGYIAQRQMRVELHDLETVGPFIERAIEAGVNQVSPPQLSSSKSREAYRQALERAADDAQQNAERLAASLGVTLGKAVRVTTGAIAGPPVPLRQLEELTVSDAAAESYNPGDLTVTATISVVFATSE